MTKRATPQSPAKNGGKSADETRFQPGNPGGPGRPAGSRNKATIALDKIADDAGEDIMTKLVEQAKSGDLRAADLVLSRIWPVRKGRPLTLAEPLPPIATAADAVAVLGKLAGLVGSGEMTAEEGAAFATIVETKRKAIETVELEARMTAIEQERKQ
jgi:Family of unknown function (DUF5681)